MEEEDNRMAELDKAVLIQNSDHKKEMEDIRNKYEAMDKSLKSEFNLEINKSNELKGTLKEEIDQAEKGYLDKRTGMESETWKQLDQEAVKNFTEMYNVTTEKSTAKNHQAETSDAKTKKELEIQNLEHDKATKANELKAKQNANLELKKERQNIDKDIEDREETIRQKKQRVEELRKKEQELEKFKFVLDYKMRELKGEMEPKKREIEKLHEQEVKMDEEVRHFTMANQNMHLIVYDLLARQQGMAKELNTQKDKEMEDDQFKARFSEDISDLCKALKANDLRLLKEKIVEYHKKYLKEGPKKMGTQAESQEAHSIKRKYYEDKIQALKLKQLGEGLHHANDNAKLMKENEKLLLQFNELSQELRFRQLTKAREGICVEITVGFGSQLSPKRAGSSKETGRTKTLGGEKKKELDIQMEEIEKLQKEFETTEEENTKLRDAKGHPQTLPPIEGGAPQFDAEQEDMDADKQVVIEPTMPEEEHKGEAA